MGRTKATLPWGDRSLLDAWIARFLEAGASEIALVVGPDIEPIRAASCEHPALRWVCNPDPDHSGPRESLLMGLDALSSGSCAWFVPVDVPVVGGEALAAVLAAFQDASGGEGGEPLAALPRYHGSNGHPVLAGADFISRLYEGEPGDRIDELLSWATRRLLVVDVDDVRVVGNMNRPQDYQAFVPPVGCSWDFYEKPEPAEQTASGETTDPGMDETLPSGSGD